MVAQLGSRYNKLWSAGVVTNVGDGIMAAALPLLVATLTRDAFLVALATVVHTLPWIVFELFAGEVVDRVDRRKLMVVADIARAGGVLLIALLIVSGGISLAVIYAIAFLLGMAETLVDTSREALVPEVVAANQLEIANGRSQAAEFTSDDLLGPPLGGFLFLLATGAPFFVNALAFAVAAALIAWIPGSFRTDREVAHGVKALRKDIGEGLRWLWGHKVLRVLSLTAGLSNLVATAVLSVFVLYAQDVLELGDLGFGIVLAAGGIGGILGAISAHSVEKAIGPGQLLILSVIGMAGGALTMALTSSPIVVGIAFALDGFMVSMWNVVVVSLRQALTPAELRGRVSSDARVLAFGAIPIGAVVGGVLANFIGIRAPFYLAAGAFALAAVVIARLISNQKIADLRAEAGAGQPDASRPAHPLHWKRSRRHPRHHS
ncbi:MAG: MFS transporter [Acidimicrobiia bacterium]|nr:MFS transporter [Acidimicrobiia bacterium]